MSAQLLTGLRIWDGEGAGYRVDADALRVEGARIVDVGRAAELRGDCEEIALDGACALPGLIDAHVHLNLDPELGGPEAQARVDDATVRSGMRERAGGMLRAGITTARDLGGPCWREVELRDAIARGEVLGPRLLCAGQPITTPRGHCWFWGGEAADADAVRALVGRQLQNGVDWIKVIATGGLSTKGTRARDPQFEVEELRAAVDAAAQAERGVAAHCHGTEGIRRAAAAGVRSVEHCSFAGAKGFGDDYDPDAVDALARGGAWVSPTVNAGWARFFDQDGEAGEFARRMSAVYTGLRQAGVPLVASTDAGIPRVAHDRLPDALPIFACLAQLEPVEALASATSVSADALGVGDVTGRLRAGLEADVLICDDDPLRDLDALRRVRLVLARGVPVRPR